MNKFLRGSFVLLIILLSALGVYKIGYSYFRVVVIADGKTVQHYAFVKKSVETWLNFFNVGSARKIS